jgi:hypothetical protein
VLKQKTVLMQPHDFDKAGLAALARAVLLASKSTTLMQLWHNAPYAFGVHALWLGD